MLDSALLCQSACSVLKELPYVVSVLGVREGSWNNTESLSSATQVQEF
jgi:hypothetical protein